LARTLLCFKQPLLSVDVMVNMHDIASNDTLSNLANFTPPMRASLLYAICSKAGVAIADVIKSIEFVRSVVAPNAFSPTVFSRMSQKIPPCGFLAFSQTDGNILISFYTPIIRSFLH